ncbi:hypothetical protein PWG71_17780 [Nocardiopsis sp. N85]|uniref:hypothetical protein n=1 Tax=Nocardiopsis sp. N85 TaxID=3029400 RepID=UPI00237F320A|nr:hypothetical protein [Nocardiopsis sp. N85]MDE3723246.1 hypothetical protein [Nocardiopsis sp. N85]
MTEPYDVDTDMGDDPERSLIEERERRIENDHGIEGYAFEDDDSRGERGIDRAVADERSDVLPRQSWDVEAPSAEEEALRVEGDGSVAEDASVRDPGRGRTRGHRADSPRGRDDRTRDPDPDAYVPDADDPRDTGAPDV